MVFRPLFELASGGMGSVALALREEGAFRRLVALKRPHTREENARKMFVEEARVAGLIRHANVVSVLDVGEDEHGPYLLMDYVEGPPLSALLRQLAGETMMPVQVALDIGRQIATGLHAAHTLRDASGQPLRLVHRDVSPENVLLGFDGLARLTDFGIAKAEGRSHERTEEGVLKGKMGYMAPELLRFDEPSVQSDLFAFGVLLYEMLSGKRLYSRKGSSAREVARRILDEAPPDLGDIRSDVPPEIDALLFDLMAKDPALRPNDAKAVADTLATVWTERVAIDGRLPLQELVQHHFADWRQSRQARIEQAVSALDAPSPAALDPEERTAEGEPTRYGKPRPQTASGGRWRWAAAAVLIGGLGGVGVWKLSLGSETSLPAEAQTPGEAPAPTQAAAASPTALAPFAATAIDPETPPQEMPPQETPPQGAVDDTGDNTEEQANVGPNETIAPDESPAPSRMGPRNRSPQGGDAPANTDTPSRMSRPFGTWGWE